MAVTVVPDASIKVTKLYRKYNVPVLVTSLPGHWARAPSGPASCVQVICHLNSQVDGIPPFGAQSHPPPVNSGELYSSLRAGEVAIA